MDLLDSVETLKGIGAKTAETLQKYGIRTVRDFLYNLPRAYEDYQMAGTIREMRPGKVTIRGTITNLTSRRAKRRSMTVIEGEIHDKTGAVKVVWFNQSYRMKQLAPEKEYYFTGTYELRNGRYSLLSPTVAEVAEVGPTASLVPVYVAHGSLDSGHFRRLIGASRDKFAEIPDLLPTVQPGVRAKSLFLVHFPTTAEQAEKARKYLAYEELFELILAARLNKQENQKLKAEKLPFMLPQVKAFLARLPFTLTGAQKKAAWEIFQDMEQETPMNRLLQGDVGSGKTMVAALAAYGASLGKAQVAILAPTAILATQHFESLSSLLGGLGVRAELLIGSTKKKAELKKRIKQGEVEVVIGTHALLTDDTEFLNLGLVIIDEQHRFGVEQRQKLVLKSPAGRAPHFLAMTATPIPRSLQLTVFGDLDVSILNELPKGRQPVKTEILREIELRERLYPEILDTLRAGRQVYWICKAIEDDKAQKAGKTKNASGKASGSPRAKEPSENRNGSTKAEITSVKARAAKLKKEFPGVKIEFLHGKMKPAEKDEIMGRFSRGEIQILVATTVVEVGVDVPNATLIAIENAETYGLAQLHQLRGRVGRGDKASACYLLTSGEMAPSRRLRELEKSNDGFYLAEVDLRLRGPGEIYGVLQHGALDLKIASFTDTELIHRVQKDVEKFLHEPENLQKHKELMAGISDYQQITTLN